MKQSANGRAQVNAAAIREIVAGLSEKPGALMPVLHAIQHRFGCIPPDAVPVIARELNLSRAEVHGVISFYHDFRSEPPGRHVIRVCRAESCQAMGANELAEHVRRRLGVDFGETTGDREFTLESVYCLGNCACSPAILIDDDIHGRVSEVRFDAILTELKSPR